MGDLAEAFEKEQRTTAREVTREEVPKFVKSLACKELHKLGRLLEIPKRSELRKAQLAAKITKVLQGETTIQWGETTGKDRMGPRRLICTDLMPCNTDADWENRFRIQINEEYDRQQKRYKAVYAQAEWKKCDTNREITLINKNDDIYYFVMGQTVKIIVIPTESVVYDKTAKGAAETAAHAVVRVMNPVWNSALNWLSPDKQNPLAVVLDDTNNGLELEFKKKNAPPTEEPRKVPVSVRPTHSVDFLVTRLRGGRGPVGPTQFAESAPFIQQDIHKVLNDPAVTVSPELYLQATGYQVRMRGTFLRATGFPNAPQEWTDWEDDAIWLISDWVPVEGKVSLMHHRDDAKRHLQFAIEKEKEPIGLEAIILPGLFLDKASTRPNKPNKINDSAIVLGMDWFASDEITLENPYLMPKPITAALHARPVYGAGDNDCLPGYDRASSTACCSYILKDALETLNVAKLESCLTGEECKGMPPEDVKQLTMYIAGEKRADDSLKDFLTSLGMSEKQLVWMMQMATHVKKTWVKYLGKAFDDMYEDAGISTNADRCAAESEAMVDMKAAGIAPGEQGYGWRFLKALGRAIATVLGTVAGALRFFFTWAMWLAEQAGMVFSSVASVGQRLATWMLNDPQKARFILVLVRRFRVSICQRFGAYLIQNGYIDVSNLNEDEARKLQEKLVELNTTISPPSLPSGPGAPPPGAGPAATLVPAPEEVASAGWFSGLRAFSKRIHDTATATAASVVTLGTDIGALAQGGIAQVTEKVFSGEAVQGMLARGGTVLKDAVTAQIRELPFIGKGLGVIVDAIGDEVGAKANETIKEALIIQRMNADLMTAMELLHDIFNVNACLLEAGFHPKIQINLETIQYVFAAVFTETRLGRAVAIVGRPVLAAGRAAWWLAGKVGGEESPAVVAAAAEKKDETKQVEKALQRKIETIWEWYFRERARREARLGEGGKKPSSGQMEVFQKEEAGFEKAAVAKIEWLEAEQRKRNAAGEAHVIWPGIVETPVDKEKAALAQAGTDKFEVAIREKAIAAEKTRPKKT